MKVVRPVLRGRNVGNNVPLPGGFGSPAVIVSEAKRLGIRILPVDIQCSQGKCTIEASAIRMGLSYVKGLGEGSIERVDEERAREPFKDIHDFCRRTRLPRRLVENLLLAGAMDGWGIERRQMLWQLARLRYEAEELDLIIPDDGFLLPPMSHAESLSYEQAVLGMTVGEHPMALYREWLDAHGILDRSELAACEHRQIVRVAGMNVMHQAPPTAKGHHFITLEDENGMMNIIVRPTIYEKYRGVLRSSRLLIVEGEVQQKDKVINILLHRAAQIPYSGTESMAG